MEVVGILTSFPDNELEETLCKITYKVGAKIGDRDIESYHCVGNQGCTKVKVRNMKHCQQLMKVKKDLSKLHSTDIDLGNTKTFFNQSPSPYYNFL